MATKKALHAANAQAATLNRFSVTDWRDAVEMAARDLMSASKQMLDLVLRARDNVHEDTVRDALEHAFGEAYADLQGIPFEQALKAKSVKNRISDAMAVFRAEVLPNVLPGNLQHAAAECRKANRKAAEPANEQPVDDLGDEGGQDEPGLELPDTVGPVDAAHHAIKAMLASLNVLRSAAKSHTLTSLLEDMAELIEEVGNELDAED